MKRQFSTISKYICCGIAMIASNGLQAEKLPASDSRERKLTLDEAICMARTQSVDAAVALNELKTAYWEYRTFRAELLPEMNFTATVPGYNKKYNSYQQDDGSYTFVLSNYIGMNGAVSIDQNIWFT